MRIVFICGSLEPGFDGVGDYTLRIACELIKQSHSASIIAFKDKYILQEFRGVLTVETQVIPILRLPFSVDNKNAFDKAKDWIESCNPEWISIQYVGFAFQKYGLPVELIKFHHFTPKAKIHIMFHELWCGMSANAEFKEKLLGKIQKIFIRIMLAKLIPERVFTNISPYSNYLLKFKIQAILAPVFGNINLLDKGSENEWGLIKNNIFSNTDINKNNWLILGFFGTIYPCTGIREIILKAYMAARQTEKLFGVLAIGNNRSMGIKKIVQELGGGNFWETGNLQPAMVNRAMEYVNLGVLTTPVDGLNKSGSAIAWLERGIPILVSPDDETYNEEIMQKDGIIRINEISDIMFAMNLNINTGKLQNRIKEIAKLYISLN